LKFMSRLRVRGLTAHAVTIEEVAADDERHAGPAIGDVARGGPSQ
jgi:hypothetical protein